MKLLVLSESPNHVSCRYRVLAFEPALRSAGWDVVVHPLTRSLPGFFQILREAEQSDVVLVQRRLLSPAKVALLRRSARRLIYDVDDAVFLRDSNSSRPAASRQRQRRFRAIVAAADAVIAGNEYLAESAARWTGDEQVAVIPTCVDLQDYPVSSALRRDKGLRLVWIGSASTMPSLNEIGAALREAVRRVLGLELHVICDRVPELPGVNTVLRRWSPASEAGDLAECDVGISWLPDHPWSRGKCGLKVLQYMAAGLPVVANAVGVHQRMIASAVNGILVDRADQLGESVRRLAASRQWRCQMGRRGRDRVEAGYSVQVWSGKFVALVERVASHQSVTHIA